MIQVGRSRQNLDQRQVEMMRLKELSDELVDGGIGKKLGSSHTLNTNLLTSRLADDESTYAKPQTYEQVGMSSMPATARHSVVNSEEDQAPSNFSQQYFK